MGWAARASQRRKERERREKEFLENDNVRSVHDSLVSMGCKVNIILGDEETHPTDKPSVEREMK